MRSSIIRDAQAADYAVVTRLMPELGVDDPIPRPERWLTELAPTTLIAERDGAPVGYAYFQILEHVGYVRHVVSAPEARRCGVGKALMDEMAARFRARGATTWCLNVRPDNLPAVQLYASLGMRYAYASAALRIEWSRIEALPPDPPGAMVSAIVPTDDRELEAAFGLPAGMLGTQRHRKRALWQVRDRQSGEPCGVAVFEPAFPGAFPFRLRRTEYAGPLLRRIASSDQQRVREWLQVVVEDDPAAVKLLQDAGAKTQLEFVHYRGAL